MFYVIKHPLSNVRISMVVNGEDLTEGYKMGIDIRHWDKIGEYTTEEEAINFAIAYDNYELPTDKPGVCQGCSLHCKFTAAFLAAWNGECSYAKGDIVVELED